MSLLVSFLLALLPLSAPQNEKTDSLVRLMSAQSAQLYQDEEGRNFRKVIGPARFLHNDTYLICDTAIWRVDDKIINAFGNVRILQEETVLDSDKLDYLIDEDLAQFRGSLVQLQDKDGNTLRTRDLDYNTRDSVATFFNGGAMRDRDGQLIESQTGTYDSKIKTFTFDRNVNMFSDSVFVRTANMEYRSEEGRAYFHGDVNAWQKENMLSAMQGYYDRTDSTFFFQDGVHLLAEDQEGWADSLYFYRRDNRVLLLGNAQVLDTTRNTIGLADYILYEDGVRTVTMKRNAAIVGETEQNGEKDTLYVGGDLIRYWTVPRNRIPETEVAAAAKRAGDIAVDPVTQYRRDAAEKAAAAAAKAKADAAKQSGQTPPPAAAQQQQQTSRQRNAGSRRESRRESRRKAKAAAEEDLTLSLADTTAVQAAEIPEEILGEEEAAVPETEEAAPEVEETVPEPEEAVPEPEQEAPEEGGIAEEPEAAEPAETPADTLSSAPGDTTAIGFAEIIGRVRLFKKDIQMRCDSLVYNDLDSLVRLYKDPILWNEGVRQYAADSISAIMRDGRLQKASLMSNAFITIQEDSLLFDQIRATEVTAFFDPDGNLSRFDALGGATTMFYLEENGSYATVNKTESKMLSAYFQNAEISEIYYFDAPKNDAYPLAQMKADDKQMKGFRWHASDKPKSPEDITPLRPRPSQRAAFAGRARPTYREAARYFPGYIDGIYRQIEVSDSLRAVRERIRAEREALERERADSLDAASLRASLDTLGTAADSLAVAADSLATGADSLAVAADSLAVAADSLQAAAPAEPTAAELRARRRQERLDAREARWAELDARDAAKAAAKEQKAAARRRKQTLKKLLVAEKQAAKDQKKLDRYVAKLEKQKARAAKRRKEKSGSE
ncbi:MAG: hypothetical protein IJM00_06375 [Bacteroidales bacterium]|nr:hypothetical protein [Bacteroidales bacterium]